ncbi:mitochondrial fission ELM1 family protein [Limibacillus halophilus]|uniref:Nucleoside-diphosphate sugar epimerase n=1 Tax=Limibacillus halophilus TaxID=1579333 RepID=A0A839T0G8_9PROT|nr:mitochondrial fission ELM1 family protein [Limibacillus halophilus]MBB3066835.1 hypothetical protein [Limibacillus halophilus]
MNKEFTERTRCWVLSDGRPGMETQCLGLAERLGMAPTIKRIDLRAPWRWLPPILQPLPFASLSPTGDNLEPPWPEVLIATGRKTAALAAAIRKTSGGGCYTVQIQNPTLPTDRFDAVILPDHDGQGARDGVITTTGALGRVTPTALTQAAAQAAPYLQNLPHPRVAVLIGGPNGVYTMPTAVIEEHLTAAIDASKALHGSLMISASNRTPDVIKARLRHAGEQLGCPVWGDAGDGENPYLSYLALADYLLVTADSVNMLCEAAATGKPLMVLNLPGGSRKFTRFHKNLRDRGITRVFSGRLENWHYEPLQEAQRVAAILATRIADHLGRRADS